MSRALRAAAVTAVTLAALVVATAVGVAATDRFLAVHPEDDGQIVLLVLGSDSGPPRAGSPLSGRADGIHLLVVSQDRQHVSILDFQRDSYVPVPGRGRSKINSCLNGGPDRCVETLQSLTGISIDGWLLTDFHGLAVGIGAIGGLEVDVEQRLADPFSGTDLQPGVQRLDGGQVLAYTRDRKSRPSGDKGRSASHSKVLAALHRQVVAEDPSVTRLAELVGTLRATTVSSLSPEETLRLAYLATSIPPDNVRMEVADAVNGRAGAASVVFLTDRATAQIADLRDDGILGPPAAPAPGPSPSG